MKRNLFIAFMVIFCFVLQSTIFHILQPFGDVVPNLLIIITSVFGFMCGQKCGLWVGFFAGLLYDIFFGSVLCYHALILMYVGYLNGSFKQIFYKDDIKLPILLIFASDLVYNIVYYVLMFLLRGRFHFTHYFLHIIVPEIVYTILVTILLYPPIRNVIYRFDHADQRSDDNFV